MSLINSPGKDIHAPLRLFRGPALGAVIAARGRTVTRDPDSVLWGVARREGCNDLDDPRAHAGLTQHAFALGQDDRALCGFRPPRRRSPFSPEPRPELAGASSDYNPTCRACVSLVEQPASALSDLRRFDQVDAIATAAVAAATPVEPVFVDSSDGPADETLAEPTIGSEPGTTTAGQARSARRSHPRRRVPVRPKTGHAS